jgi:predicted RNA-binding Zn ribbon-like protein
MSEPEFELSGGHLALDFANTVSSYVEAPRRDRLVDFDALLRWARQAGLIGEAELRRLRAEAARRPGEAARVLAQAIALREALYRAFTALIGGDRPRAGDVEAINGALAAALPHQRLIAGRDGFALGWERRDDALDAPLWPVARAAAELITSPALLERVHRCEAAARGTCTWLFVDESRNRSRRWCSMKDCGNRAKARRHYEKVSGSRS